MEVTFKLAVGGPPTLAPGRPKKRKKIYLTFLLYNNGIICRRNWTFPVSMSHFPPLPFLLLPFLKKSTSCQYWSKIHTVLFNICLKMKFKEINVTWKNSRLERLITHSYIYTPQICVWNRESIQSALHDVTNPMVITGMSISQSTQSMLLQYVYWSQAWVWYGFK